MVEQVWIQFHQQLLNFIKSKVKDKSAAEDILQEVFIKVHQHLANLQDEKKLSSWLYQICRHSITDYYRKLKPVESDIDLDSFVAEQAPENCDEQINSCMQVLIKELPDNYRKILLDSEMNNKKQAELVNIHQISLPAVKSRIKRGRSLLKDKLQLCCDWEFSEQGISPDCKSGCGCQ